MDGFNSELSRRHALLAGAGLLGSAALLGTPGLPALASSGARTAAGRRQYLNAHILPIKKMEDILQTQGMVSNHVLSFMLFRTDIHVIGPNGIRWSPYFQSMHEFYFQALGHDKCILNCDITFTERETERVFDAIQRNGFVIQAQHQHYIGENPQTWHYHFRKIGHPVQIAHQIVNVLKSTSTPFPQKSGGKPKTPLPADELGKILGGSADVREDGVVEVSVDRRNHEVLYGKRISPELNVASTITFQPLNSSGTEAMIGPDLSMTYQEVQRTLRKARKLGYAVHCLYNQETNEHPQLFFSHLLKTGSPTQLAREVREILDETNVEDSPGWVRD